MKKLMQQLCFVLLTVLLGFTTMIPVYAFIEDVDDEEETIRETFVFQDFTYEILEDDTILLTGYIGDEENLSIPSEIDGHDRIWIKERAFADRSDMKSIVIPGSVKMIQAEAFLRNSIEEVILEDGVEIIGRGAFLGSGIREIVLPDSVTSIGADIFSCCINLKRAVLSKGLTLIPVYAFENCTQLEEIVIPEGIEVISSLAFNYDAKLETVVFPSTLKRIEGGVFANCEGLKDVLIPETIVEISEEAFYECPQILLHVYPDTEGLRYAKAESIPYKIMKRSLADCTIDVKDVAYSGKAAVPEVQVKYGDKVLKSDVDYTLHCDAINIGNATLTVTGIGNYEGSVDVAFKILEKTNDVEIVDTSDMTHVYLLSAFLLLSAGTITFLHLKKRNVK